MVCASFLQEDNMVDDKQHPQEAWAGNNHFFRAALSQTERSWALQQRLMNIYGNFMSHWFQRRQRAAETALEATKKILTTNGDAGKFSGVCEDWLKGSWERIAEDMKECQECLGEAAEAVQGGLTDVSQQKETVHQKAKA
jgi:hypothetical protein